LSNFKKFKDIVAFIYYKLFYKPFYKGNKKFNYILDNKNQKKLSELKKNGYVVIENFLSKKECDQIKNEIDLFCQKRAKEVFAMGGYDQRIYGLNLISKKAKIFLRNKNIKNILGKYANNNELTFSFTLGQKTICKKNNTGSGAGWHIDHTILKYPKAMLYLVTLMRVMDPFNILKELTNF